MADAAAMPPPRAVPQLMIPFSVNVGVPRSAATEDQPTQSTGKKDKRHSFVVPADPTATFGALWTEIDRRYREHGFDDKDDPDSYFHRLESHDHAAIDHRDVVGSMYSRDSPAQERVLYVVRNTRDRLSSVAPNTSLRPTQYNHRALNEEQREDLLRRQAEHKAGNGRADEDTPLPSRENGEAVGQEAAAGRQKSRLDSDGFAVPALPQTARQPRGLAQTLRTTQSARRAASSAVQLQQSHFMSGGLGDEDEDDLATSQATVAAASTTRKRKRRSTGSTAQPNTSRARTLDTVLVTDGQTSKTKAIPTPPDTSLRHAFEEPPESAQRPKPTPATAASTQRGTSTPSRSAVVIPSTAEIDARDAIFLEDYPAPEDDDIEDDEEPQVRRKAQGFAYDRNEMDVDGEEEDEDGDEQGDAPPTTTASKPHATQSSNKKRQSSSGLTSSLRTSASSKHTLQPNSSGSRGQRGTTKVLWTRTEDDILRQAAENGTTAASLLKDGLIVGRTGSAIRGRTRLLVQKYGIQKQPPADLERRSSQPSSSQPPSSQPGSSRARATQRKNDRPWTQQERDLISQGIRDGKDANEIRLPGRSVDAVAKKYKRWQKAALGGAVDEQTYPDDSVTIETWTAREGCRLRRAVREDLSFTELHQKYFSQWNLQEIKQKYKAYERQVKLLSGNASVNSTAESQQSDDASASRTVGQMLRDLEASLAAASTPPPQQQRPELLSSSSPPPTVADAIGQTATVDNTAAPSAATRSSATKASRRKPMAREHSSSSLAGPASGTRGQQRLNVGNGRGGRGKVLNGLAPPLLVSRASDMPRSRRQNVVVREPSEAVTDPDELEAFQEMHYGSDATRAVPAQQGGGTIDGAAQRDAIVTDDVAEDDMDTADPYDIDDTAAEDLALLDETITAETTTPDRVRVLHEVCIPSPARVRAAQAASDTMGRMLNKDRPVVPPIEGSQESSVAFQTQDPLDSRSQRLARELGGSLTSHAPTTQDEPLTAAGIHAAKQQASLAQGEAVGTYDASQSDRSRVATRSSRRARRKVVVEPDHDDEVHVPSTPVIDSQSTTVAGEGDASKGMPTNSLPDSQPPPTAPTTDDTPPRGKPIPWHAGTGNGDVAWDQREPAKSNAEVLVDLFTQHPKLLYANRQRRERAFQVFRHNADVAHASKYDDENEQKRLAVRAKKRCRERRVEDGRYWGNMKWGYRPRWHIVSALQEASDVDEEIIRLDNASEVTNLTEDINWDDVEVDSKSTEREKKVVVVDSDLETDRHFSEVESGDEADEDDEPVTPSRRRAPPRAAAVDEDEEDDDEEDDDEEEGEEEQEEILYDDEESTVQARQNAATRARFNRMSGNGRQPARSNQFTDPPLASEASVTTSEAAQARRHRRRRHGRRPSRRDSSADTSVPLVAPNTAPRRPLTAANVRRLNGESSSTPARSSDMPPPPRRSPRNRANVAAVRGPATEARRNRPQSAGVRPMRTPMRQVIERAVVPEVPVGNFTTPRRDGRFMADDGESSEESRMSE